MDKTSFPLGQTHWRGGGGGGGREGRQGFVKVDEKAATQRWWIDDDVWKGCVCIYVCVGGGLFTCTWSWDSSAYILCWADSRMWSKQIIYHEWRYRFSSKRMCYNERKQLVSLPLHLDEVPDCLYTHRTSGNLELDNKTAVFLTPLFPSPSPPITFKQYANGGEPSRCRAVRSFRVTDQYFLIRAALP